MSTTMHSDLGKLAGAVSGTSRRTADSPAALVLKQDLAPVEGRDAILFPPTYAIGKEKRSPYNISPLDDGTNVVAIDSVGSHANRLEPLFDKPGYEGLVPRVTVEVSKVKDIPAEQVSLLEIGHRIGDALVRGTDAEALVSEAFKAAGRGDVGKVAAVAPTSLLFGVWDSRNTRVKLKRLLSGRIDAYDVSEVYRSAQYVPPVEYKEIGLDLDKNTTEAFKKEEEADKSSPPGKLSEGGFAPVPSVGVRGGVVAKGPIRRTLVLNLTAIGHLSSLPPVDPVRLREYLFGLGLVAMTAPLDPDLRSGCLLVNDGPTVFELVRQDGRRESVSLDHDAVVEWAKGAAQRFWSTLPKDQSRDSLWTVDRPKLSGQVRKSLKADEKPANQAEKAST